MKLGIDFTGSADRALAVQDALTDLPDVARLEVERPEGRPDNITGAEVALGLGLIYVVPIAAAHVIDIVLRVRQLLRPLSVLDLTGDEPKLTIIEDAPGHEGELVIKTRAGEEVTVAERPEIPRDELIQAVQKYLPGS